MTTRIAIPEPSCDADYNADTFHLYLTALSDFGAEPVVIRLQSSQAEVARQIATAQGVLLPGSKFDVDPERYHAERQPACGPADAARTAVDELLLQDAFHLRKPVLGICHGAQSMNTWCDGTLIQDLQTQVQHRAGRSVAEAHMIQIVEGSMLASWIANPETLIEPVNSTHHQAVANPGDRLRVAALSPADGVIEAIEGVDALHFVLGVQWHPERTLHTHKLSQRIFQAFVEAASSWQEERNGR